VVGEGCGGVAVVDGIEAKDDYQIDAARGGGER